VTTTDEHTPVAADAAVVGRLSVLDRFLPMWIAAAMALGLLASRAIPELGRGLDAVKVDGISLPIAVGLLVMMYPVPAKVRYDRLGTVTRDRRLLIPSLLLNWIVASKEPWCPTFPRSYSFASTTPAAPKWPPPCSTTTPPDASAYAPPDPPPPTPSTPPSSPSWKNSAST
jgi:hypothetical protein